MSKIDDLRDYVNSLGTAPSIDEMPRRTLSSKGIFGPTGAHVIEEIHTPFNFHYITVTTGSTAFQNIVGVTKNEIPDRIEASIKALRHCNVKKGEKVLVTYPPLVNVFTKESFEKYELNWFFLTRSERDALILSLAENKPKVVIGESSFIKATLEDAKKIGMIDLLPKDMIFITAGTPLDVELIDVAKRYVNGEVHDLYGCQEFGWLTVDGIPLREDIKLLPHDDNYYDLIVGGLPVGDRFPVNENGHICNKNGKIITYGRIRTSPELEVTIMETIASAKDTVDRLSRGILRIKGRIVRVSDNLKLSSDKTVLMLSDYKNTKKYIIDNKNETILIDSLLKSQQEYQSQKKNDQVWIKSR